METKQINFWKDEEGIGTLEILLIIAVIVIIAIAFRKWIFNWVKQLFEDTEIDLKNNREDPISINPPNS